MEILSKDTLQLLQNEKLRDTVHRVLEQADIGQSQAETVTITKVDEQPPREVTVRRLSA